MSGGRGGVGRGSRARADPPLLSPSQARALPSLPPPSPSFTDTLTALTSLAAAAAPPLLDALLTWRKDALAGVPAGDDEAVLGGRLAAESVFLDAAAAVAAARGSGDGDGDASSAPPSSHLLAERQAAALQALALDWIMHSLAYAPARHAGLAPARAAVVAGAARVLAALAPARLRAVTAAAAAEIDARLDEDSASIRGELLALVSALGGVRLSFDSDAAADAATDFVAALHPLRARAAVRKSQVSHALADALGQVLGAVADAGGVPGAALSLAALDRWRRGAASLRRDTGAWLARHPSKHAKSALPLLTAALACEGDVAFAEGAPAVVAALHRGVRDRGARAAAARAAARVAASLAARPGLAPPGEMAPCRDTWLTGLAAPVVAAARKAGAGAAECGEGLEALALALAAERPSLGIEAVVLELLASADGSAPGCDLAAAGVRALRALLARAGIAGLTPARVGVDNDLLTTLAAAGGDAMAAAGAASLARRARSALGVAFASVAPVLAPHRPPLPGARTEPFSRDKLAPSARLLASILDLTPALVHAGWDADKAVDDLPAWTLAIDDKVAVAARSALRRVGLCAAPSTRARALASCARLALALPDASCAAQRCALALTRSVGDAWGRAVADAAAEGGAQAARAHLPPPEAQADALRAVDAAALIALCSSDAATRLDAAAVASWARSLGAALDAARAAAAPWPASPPPPPPRLADVIDGAGDALASRACWDWTAWADAREAARDAGLRPWRSLLAAPAGGDAGPSRARWVAQIGCRAAAAVPGLGSDTLQAALRRLATALRRDGAPRAPAPADADAAWALASLACALPPSDREAAGHRSLFATLALSVRATPPADGGGPRGAVPALAFCAPGAHAALVASLRPLRDELASEKARAARGRGRKDDARAALAHVWRLAAASAPPSAFARPGPLRAALLDWAADTLRWLVPAHVDGSLELQQVRLCLAVVARRLASELGAADPSSLPRAARSALFDACGAWCGDGATPGKLRADIARGAAAARARHRDPRVGAAAEEAALRLADAVEHAALQAQAALLLGPPLDPPGSDPASSALAWAGTLLRRPDAGGASGRAATAAATAGLRNALASQPRAAPAYVDAALSPDPAVAAAHAAALADVYRAVPLPLPLPALAFLALHGAGAPVAAHRRAARRVLAALERRAWGRGGGVGGSVDGARSDSDACESDGDHDAPPAPSSCDAAFDGDQARLAARLAAEHPELAPALLVEATRRLLRLSAARRTQRGVLRALAPLVRVLDFGADARSRGGGGGTALGCLLALTGAAGAAGAGDAEALWAAAADAPGNAGAALSLLVSALLGGLPDVPRPGLGESAAASRWLARAAPDECVAALAAEVAGGLGAAAAVEGELGAPLASPVDVLLGDDDGAASSANADLAASGSACASGDSLPSRSQSRSTSVSISVSASAQSRAAATGAPPAASPASPRVVGALVPSLADDPRARAGAALWLLAPVATIDRATLAPRAPLVAHAALLAAARGESGPARGAVALLDALAEAAGTGAAVVPAARALACAVRPAELAAAVARFVSAALPALPLAPDARPPDDGWAEVALRCALGCGDAHEAAASHAALRALAPAAVASVAPALAAAAAAAASSGDDATARATLGTLAAYVRAGDARARGLAVGLAACAARGGPLAASGVRLAATALDGMDVSDVTSRLALLAALPEVDSVGEGEGAGARPTAWPLGDALLPPSDSCRSAQTLLCDALARAAPGARDAARGATAAAAALAAARVPPALPGWTTALSAPSPALPAADVLGDATDQLAGALFAGLPWAAAAARAAGEPRAAAAAFLRAHANAAAAVGLTALARALNALEASPSGDGRLTAAAAAAAALVPGREAAAVAALTATLTSTSVSHGHRAAAMASLAAVLAAGGPAAAAGAGDSLAAAARALGGPLRAEALATLRAAIGAGGGDAGTPSAGLPADGDRAAAALARLAAAWPVAAAGGR